MNLKSKNMSSAMSMNRFHQPGQLSVIEPRIMTENHLQNNSALNFRGRNIKDNLEAGQQSVLNEADSPKLHNKRSSHTRTSSHVHAPTPGEFQIMRHLGEDAYSLMKSVGGSRLRQKEPIQLAKTVMSAANRVKSGKNTYSSRLSRPITSSTKPSIN